jgi:hypothetical protein
MTHFKNKIWLLPLSIAVFILCYIEAEGKGDFFIFMSATGDLIKHQDFYKATYVNGYHYFYSVFFALLLKPFYYLPFFWVKFSWLLLNVLFYFSLISLLIKNKLLDTLSEKQKRLFISLVVIFSLRFFLDNIHNSQTTILILWCCIYGMYLVTKNKPISGAAILALGINIKLMPIVFLPYLIYRGYFKAFLFTILFYFAYMFFPSLLIGNEYNMSLLKTWLSLINPSNKNHVLDVEERSFHGLSTLLSTLFVKDVPDTFALSLKRNIADVSVSTLASILLFTRLALASITLLFLKLKPFVIAKTHLQQYLETSYLLLVVPLIFPHQQHYAFLFAVPAFAAILFVFISQYNKIHKSTRVIITFLLVLIYLCENLKLVLGEFNPFYEHYKIVTYGALLLIPLLIWANRRVNEIDQKII